MQKWRRDPRASDSFHETNSELPMTLSECQSLNKNEGRTLGHDAANLAAFHTVTDQGRDAFRCGFRSDGGEQAARGLRIEEQITKLLWHIFRKFSAFGYERAIILEPSGKMTIACGFDRTGKIREGRVVNFKRCCLDSATFITVGVSEGVAERHFASVSEYAK